MGGRRWAGVDGGWEGGGRRVGRQGEGGWRGRLMVEKGLEMGMEDGVDGVGSGIEEW